MSWRMDRQGAEPEFYDTQAAADRRAWALRFIAGEKRDCLVWFDCAEYEPIIEETA